MRIQLNNQTIDLDIDPAILVTVSPQQIRRCAKTADETDIYSWLNGVELTLDGSPSFRHTEHFVLCQPPK